MSLSRFDLNVQTDRCMTSKHRDLCSTQTCLIPQPVCFGGTLTLTSTCKHVVGVEVLNCELSPIYTSASNLCRNLRRTWLAPLQSAGVRRRSVNWGLSWHKVHVFKWISHLNEWLMRVMTAIYWWFGFIFKSIFAFSSTFVTCMFKNI